MSPLPTRTAACKYCGEPFVQELQERLEDEPPEFPEFWYPPFCESVSCTQTDNALSEAAASHKRAHTPHGFIVKRIHARADRLQWALENRAPEVIVREFGRMLTDATAELVRRKPSKPDEPIRYFEESEETAQEGPRNI